MDLKDGEVICPECEGNYIVGKGKSVVWGCDKCKGYGKLDWIENIVGKKEDMYTPYKPKLSYDFSIK